jgi:hypothetical protein
MVNSKYGGAYPTRIVQPKRRKNKKEEGEEKDDDGKENEEKNEEEKTREEEKKYYNRSNSLFLAFSPTQKIMPFVETKSVRPSMSYY